jgi:hypothetical protein
VKKNLNKKHIICGGMYRSGTTLVYNLIIEIIKKHTGSPGSIIPTGTRIDNFYVHKYHQETPDFLNSEDALVIYSYRNVLDCLVSFFQKYNKQYNNFQLQGRDSIQFIDWMIELDFKMLSSTADYLEISYEKEISNVILLCEKLKNFLNLYVEIDVEKYLFDNLKRKIDSLRTVDRESNFWPNHLNDGKVGKFKEFLTREQMEQIYKLTDYQQWAIRRDFMEKK